MGRVYTTQRACACCMHVCVCTPGLMCVPARVFVCSLGLFSVVSLIIRKVFNVFLPVERGREYETVIAEIVGEKSKGDGKRQTL